VLTVAVLCCCSCGCISSSAAWSPAVAQRRGFASCQTHPPHSSDSAVRKVGCGSRCHVRACWTAG
jgi:hypothetical protein